MTLAVFFGCTFIAFGPALGLFLFTIARDPLRIIILIAGAFFWLVSLLLSSLIWFIAVKASDPRDEALQKGLLIFGVMFSVLLQEAFRFLYYKLLSGWCGLRAHERRFLHDQSSGRLVRARHCGHPWGFTALLPDLSFYDHGADFPSHLLGDPLLPRLRAPALVGDRGGCGHAPRRFGVDLLEPPVRGQPGALLLADGCCRHLGLPTLGGICSEPAALPALSTERSQPPARILSPQGMFLSPATPALPSILTARAAVTFSAISFLLDCGTPASGSWLTGVAGAGLI
uniref:Gamma-secretase subunit APH-1 n=1 Tax=Calidris pygmaea TaxID=425635 RepID=A0A8C3KJQ3_9CHAR